MQKEIVKVIREFFDGHLSRTPTHEEIQKLHDEFTPDYEGMVNYAASIGIEYRELLLRALGDHYADEIIAETEAHQLYIQFRTVSELALAGVEKLKQVAEKILKSPHTPQVVDLLGNDSQAKVTIIEPGVLTVCVDETIKLCGDATLKEMVLRKDPTLSKVASDGKPWFATIIDDGRLTVDSIKRVREVFDPALVDVRDGRRIVELVLEGIIVKPQ